MKLNKVSQSLAVALVIGASSQAFAGGYMLSELGELSTSTAGAGFAALGEGAETAFANPAGMTRSKRKHIATNLGLLNLDSTNYDMGTSNGEGVFDGCLNNYSSESSSKKLLPISSFYFTNEINDKFSFGVTMGAIGGSGFGYGSCFAGSIMAEDGLLLTAQLDPSVSYKVNDKLSLGGGESAEMAYINQTLGTEAIDGGMDFIEGEVPADDVAFGLNVGAMYQFSDANRLGFTYRSQITHELKGDFDVGGELGRSVRGELGIDRLPTQINVTMPAQAKLSSFHVVESNAALLWTLRWQDLSAAKQTDVVLHGSNSPVIRDWKDTYSAAVGGHFSINNSLRFELGYSYQTSSQDAPKKINLDVPTGAVSKYSTGLTWFINDSMRAQFYYDYLDGGSARTQALDNLTVGELIQPNGVYDMNVNIVREVLPYTF
ncbi:outer membrane protein transport protein [Vibrio sp. CUB2]|uniref:OmpP1/FadL family transporter n=1 Tax=Vibrio sp. CUB2 TaxID=2315233 RepID=UPI00076A10A1|nr:outer membrane protein transport protein [Vibrio sp. CUB2]